MTSSKSLARVDPIYEAARAAVMRYSPAGTDFTQPEKLAILNFGMINYLSKHKVGADLVMGRVLHDIATLNLHTVHPEQYDTVEQGAQLNGMSASDASDLRTIWATIVPKMIELGYEPIDTISEIGYQKFRQLIPTLSQLIDPKDKVRDTVQEAVDNMLSEAEGNVNNAIHNVIALGKATTREIRRILRPVRTPPIDFVQAKKKNKTFIVAELSQEQLDMLNKLLKEHMNTSYVDLEDYQPSQVPVLRSIIT